METSFPHLLRLHAARRPSDAALREKAYGIWQTWNWQQVDQDVRHLAWGLDALGFAPDDNLAIVGDNRP